MDEFGCDYGCRTVREGLNKYDIPDDWTAEFDAYDGVYPIACIPVGKLRKTSALMEINLRMVENENDEYAGCMVLMKRKTIAFKVERMSDLVKAMEK